MTKLIRVRIAGAVLLAAVCTPAAAVPIQWSADSGGNDHFYDFVDVSLTWSDARTAAESLSFMGLSGYLTTITSQGEQDFVRSITSSPGWLGGSDTSVEGTWEWLTGPEAGTAFWRDGTTLTYANWATGDARPAARWNRTHHQPPYRQMRILR